MKKAIVFTASLIGFTLFGSGTTAFAQENGLVNELSYTPFTKSLKHRLDHDRIDPRQLKFYTDRELVLRQTNGAQKTTIKNGTLVVENGQYNNDIVIPAYTTATVKSISGDSMTVYFDSPANTFTFGALYANDNYKLLGSSWYNGTTDITYNNKTYQVYCGDCGSAANVQLVIQTQESNNDKPADVINTMHSK
jgi:hypothetical protein